MNIFKIASATTLSLLAGCALLTVPDPRQPPKAFVPNEPVFEHKKGTFTDPRDGKTYETVDIGTQTWMAENLSYEAEGSVCYNNSESNCEKYGRLYNWLTAMELPSKCQGLKLKPDFNNPNNKTNIQRDFDPDCAAKTPHHQGICPDGWHVSSEGDWETLTSFAGANAGTRLKSTSGWVTNGSDSYGFAALPGGDGVGSGSDPKGKKFYDIGSAGIWWTTTGGYAPGGDAANRMSMNSGSYTHAKVEKRSETIAYQYSVRCVKD